MLCVYFFPHRKISLFSLWKTAPKTVSQTPWVRFYQHPCNCHEVAFLVELHGWLEWQQGCKGEHQGVNFKCVVHSRGCWQVKLIRIIVFVFCYHKGSDASNWVCFVISEAQSDITFSGWCSNVAVRLMGYPAEAEMVWSTTKDHLQVCRKSAPFATLTPKGNNNTPTQASLQSPSSHAFQGIQININKVDVVSKFTIHSVHCFVVLAVTKQYSTGEDPPIMVWFS